MIGIYNPLLVCVSLVVAFLASYTTVELSGTISTVQHNRRRVLWLAGGAVSMGVGIWSMHFIGMIAFSLPIAIGYNFGTTVISLLLAIGASFIALTTASRGALSFKRLCVAGTVMGIGVAGMHYMGMHALQMSPPIRYSAWRLLVSIVEAIAASIAALRIAFMLHSAEHEHLVAKRLGAAAVMALAITCMHYTGMSAAHFAIGSVCGAAHDISGVWLAVIVTVTSSAVLIGTLALLSIHANNLSSSLKDAKRQLRYLGTHDALTGLPNREQLARHVAQSIAGASRTGQNFAVLFVDLDGFKAVNDSFGHRIGDELLKICADRLQHQLRQSDFVARLGGDEFIVVIGGLSETTTIEARANDLLDRLRQEVVIASLPLRVGASIGVAVYPQDGDGFEVLLHNADAAMYVSKQSGRNTFRRFELAMTDAERRLSMLQRDLQHALLDKQLSIVFQSKYNMNDGAMRGAEALVRWTHPEIGDVPPSEFIPVAERTGLVLPIGEWVLSEVCACIAAWNAQELPPWPVSVNLSPIQLNAPDIVDRIDAIVTAAGVAPERLMFEIAETVAMKSTAKTGAVIDLLQARGYKVAIDDFGSGYSSLSYLRSFKVNQIKVDKSFIQSLDTADPQALSLVTAIVALAQTMDVEVVAEGVETEAQRATLVALKCDQMQGFLMSRPMPPEEFRVFLRDAQMNPSAGVPGRAGSGGTANYGILESA